MPGYPWTATAEHQHRIGGHVEVGVVDACVEVLDRVEDDGVAAVTQQVRRGSGRLDQRTTRSEVAAENGDAALGDQRTDRGRMTSGIPDRGVVEVVDQRLPGHRHCGAVEEVADLAQYGEQTTGAVEVVHQEPTSGQQIHQHRHVRPDPIEVVERQVDADAPSDGQQVDHGVGGSADGG